MDIEAIKAIVTGSNIYVTWSLSIVGASLVTIFSTSFIKMDNKCWRLIYLLFIPGWACLILSIKNGEIIVRRGIMAAVNPQQIDSIANSMNDNFLCQLSYFNYGLICFVIWLIIFLFWWIFKYSNNLKQA